MFDWPLGNPATHTMTAVMPNDFPDTEPLLEEMKRRRLKSEETNDPIIQTAVAEQMGVSPSYVSLLERGKRRLWKLPGTQLYILLRGYRYQPSEIAGIVSRYRLNTPPQLLENPTVESGTVVVVSEGGISQPGESREVEVQRSALLGLDPTVITERKVLPHDLATSRAQARAGVDTQLIVTATVQPIEDSLVIVEQDGVQALAVWPVKADWAMPYRMGGRLGAVALDATQLRLVAVVVNTIVPQPFERVQES